MAKKNKNKNTNGPKEDTRDLHKAFIKNRTKGRQREKKYMKDVEEIGENGYDELDTFEKY